MPKPVRARNAFYAQSGGVTAVINASACGVIQMEAGPVVSGPSVQLFLFPEVVEDWGVIGRTGVKGPLDGLRRTVVILHVIGK